MKERNRNVLVLALVEAELIRLKKRIKGNDQYDDIQLPRLVKLVSEVRERTVANIKRKEEQNKRLGEEMVRLVRDYTIAEIKGALAKK